MQIGAVGFSPYIYNTNTISRSSMSPISGISDNLLSSKTDFSGLTSEAENENPLRLGETSNFMDVLDMQMQMGRLNASRIMKSAEEVEAAGTQIADMTEMDVDSMQMDLPKDNVIASDMVQSAASSIASMPEETFTLGEDTAQVPQMGKMQNFFQMQKAIEAYQVNMTA